jgi:hypothetical protein
MKRILGVVLLAVGCASASACDATYPTVPSDLTPVSLQLFYNMEVGAPVVNGTYSFAAYTVTAEGAYENVTSKSTWIISDPLVFRASINTPGMYTAIAPGPVDVLARYEEMTSTASLFVTRRDRQLYPYLTFGFPDPPRMIGKSSQAALRMQQSATQWLAVTEPATWTSSDPAVATVERGLVTAVRPGVTQIAAEYDGMLASYVLAVAPRTR